MASCCAHPAPDDAGEILHLTEGCVASPHLVLDLADAVQHGRVVSAAEDLADLQERQPGALAGELHRDVARLRERP